MADHGGNETVACMCSSQYTKVLDTCFRNAFFAVQLLEKAVVTAAEVKY